MNTSLYQLKLYSFLMSMVIKLQVTSATQSYDYEQMSPSNVTAVLTTECTLYKWLPWHSVIDCGMYCNNKQACVYYTKQAGSCCLCIDSTYTEQCSIQFQLSPMAKIYVKTGYIDNCASNTCSVGTTCVNGVQQYTCQDIDECSSDPCMYGTCSNLYGGFQCTCNSGYTGDLCSEDYDECSSNPCYNGLCNHLVNSYSCSCYSGWYDADCGSQYVLVSTTARLVRESHMDVSVVGSLYGRLEVYYNGGWGTVCDDGFGAEDASVACTMMGGSSPTTIGDAQYGTLSILLDDLACSGTESSFDLCSPTWGSHNCVHSEDVAMGCN